MNFIIRKATESDFDSIFSLVYGLAVFQGTPERIVNSVDQMKEEKQYFQSYVAETSDGEIIGWRLIFLRITPGLANHFSWMICL
jgi:diamine N-acetyltransferase